MTPEELAARDLAELDAPQVKIKTKPGVRLNPELQRALADLQRRAAGYDVQVNSGVRSRGEQERLYAGRGSNPNPVARPGTSPHESGRSVDLSVFRGGRRVPQSEIAAHAAEAGLRWHGPRDPVHFDLASRSGPDPSLAARRRVIERLKNLTPEELAQQDLVELKKPARNLADTPEALAARDLAELKKPAPPRPAAPVPAPAPPRPTLAELHRAEEDRFPARPAPPVVAQAPPARPEPPMLRFGPFALHAPTSTPIIPTPTPRVQPPPSAPDRIAGSGVWDWREGRVIRPRTPLEQVRRAVSGEAADHYDTLTQKFRGMQARQEAPLSPQVRSRSEAEEVKRLQDLAGEFWQETTARTMQQAGDPARMAFTGGVGIPHGGQAFTAAGEAAKLAPAWKNFGAWIEKRGVRLTPKQREALPSLVAWKTLESGGGQDAVTATNKEALAGAIDLALGVLAPGATAARRTLAGAAFSGVSGAVGQGVRDLGKPLTPQERTGRIAAGGGVGAVTGAGGQLLAEGFGAAVRRGAAAEAERLAAEQARGRGYTEQAVPDSHQQAMEARPAAPFPFEQRRGTAPAPPVQVSPPKVEPATVAPSAPSRFTALGDALAAELGVEPLVPEVKAAPAAAPKAARARVARPAPAPDPAQVEEALEAWSSGRAYVDGNGNYHLRARGNPHSRGPIAPWNRAAKQAFKSVDELHAAAQGRAAAAPPKSAPVVEAPPVAPVVEAPPPPRPAPDIEEAHAELRAAREARDAATSLEAKAAADAAVQAARNQVRAARAAADAPRPSPVTTPEAPKVEVVGKEPWQMTRGSYHSSVSVNSPQSRLPQGTGKPLDELAKAHGWEVLPTKGYNGNPPGLEIRSPEGIEYRWNRSMRHGGGDPWEPTNWHDLHQAAVERALSEGKPVPPEVLADYPDLKPPPKAAPEPPKATAPEVKPAPEPAPYRPLARHPANITDPNKEVATKLGLPEDYYVTGASGMGWQIDPKYQSARQIKLADRFDDLRKQQVPQNFWKPVRDELEQVQLADENALRARLKAQAEPAPSALKTTAAKLKAAGDRTAQELADLQRERGGLQGSAGVPDPQVLAKAAKLVAIRVAEGAVNSADFLVTQYGEQYRPHLAAIWKEARRQYDELLKDAENAREAKPWPGEVQSPESKAPSRPVAPAAAPTAPPAPAKPPVTQTTAPAAKAPAVKPEAPAASKPTTAPITEATGLANQVQARQFEAGIIGRLPEKGKSLTFAEMHAEGKRLVESGEVDPEALAREIGRTGRPYSDVEGGALLVGEMRHRNAVNAAKKALDAAIDRKAPETEIGPRREAYERAYDAHAAYLDDVQKGKSALSGGFRSLQLGMTLDEGDFAQVIQAARRQAGPAFDNDSEAAKRLKALTDELGVAEAPTDPAEFDAWKKTVQGQIVAQEAEVTASQAERVTAAEVRTARKGRTRDQVTKIRADRASIIADIKKIRDEIYSGQPTKPPTPGPGMRSGAVVNPAMVLYDAGRFTTKAGPLAGRLALSYLKEGAVRLDDVAKSVIEDLAAHGVTITRDQVITDLVEAGKRTRKTRTQLQEQIATLKAEARQEVELRRKIDNLQKGLPSAPPAKRKTLADGIKRLQKELADLRESPEGKDLAAQARVRGQIVRLKAGEPARGRTVVPGSPELQALRTEAGALVKVRRQTAAQKAREARIAGQIATLNAGGALPKTKPRPASTTPALDEQLWQAKAQARIRSLEEQLRTGQYEVPTPREVKATAEYEKLRIKQNILAADVRAELAKIKRRAEYEKLPPALKAGAIASDLLFGAPRSFVASFDLTVPTIQGGTAMYTDPKRWGQATLAMFKGARQAGFNEIAARVRLDPDYIRMRQAKLELPGVHGESGEEQLVSTSLEKLPLGIGLSQRVSRRTYDAHLLALRSGMFKDWLRGAEAGGKPLSKEGLEVLGDAVNTFTGRGAEWVGRLGSKPKVFFALRYTMSNVEHALLAPFWKAARHGLQTGEMGPLKVVTQKYALGLVGQGMLIGGAAVALGASNQKDAKIETDPRHVDFSRLTVKLKGGTETLVIPIGSPLFVTMGQIVRIVGTGFLGQKRIGVSGKEASGGYAASAELGSFLLNRVTPLLSTAKTLSDASANKNKKVFGESYDLNADEGRWNLAYRHAPISAQGFRKLMESKELTDEEKMIAFAVFVKGIDLRKD